MNNAIDRVATGARLLDEKRPGWPSHITEPIDMASCEKCILGQSYGSFTLGLSCLGIPSDQLGEEYGFNAINFINIEEYRELEKLWASEISKRQSQPTEFHFYD